VESGTARPDFDTVQLLVEWLDVPIERVMRARAAKKKRAPEVMANTLTQIEVHLRADPNLSPDAAKALTDIVRAAYPNFAKKR